MPLKKEEKKRASSQFNDRVRPAGRTWLMGESDGTVNMLITMYDENESVKWISTAEFVSVSFSRRSNPLIG